MNIQKVVYIWQSWYGVVGGFDSVKLATPFGQIARTDLAKVLVRPLCLAIELRTVSQG